MDTTLEQLRHIRSENAKRDNDLRLMKGDIAALTHQITALDARMSGLEIRIDSHLKHLIDILTAHRDVMDTLNERQQTMEQLLTELLNK